MKNNRQWWVMGNAAVAVLLVLALGVAVGFGAKWFFAWQEDASRAEPVEAATEGVLALMSVSPATIDSDLAAVEALATGTFAEELAAGRDQVRESVLNNVVTQQAEVTNAAYAGGDSDSATVILSVTTVTVYATPPPDEETTEEEPETDEEGDADAEPEPLKSHYRVKAELALVDDQWLISVLEIG